MNINGRGILRWLAAIVLGIWLFTPEMARARSSEIGYPTFLSPHASPIVVSGGQVFVSNTAADTVDVIDAGSRIIVSRINVGIDPVALAVRPDGKEIWVSNHVSDSVSVIDTDPASLTHLQVIATVQDFDPVTKATRFDEPVGIAFAGNDKAYVALSSENQIAVINVATRYVANKLDINAQDPRAIRVRGSRLYVVPFESNNQTQISGCVDSTDPELCTFDATEHVITNNNVLSRNAIVDIVRNPEVPDRDLYVFDTANDQLVEVVESLGTLLYGLAVDSRARVFIAQTDARNDANGRAGTFGEGLDEMENRAFLNQVTQVDCNGLCGQAHFIDLEPLPPVDPAPGLALATPFAIEISADDATLVLSAAGSDQLFTVDANSGEILGRVAVGSAPRGIALESDGAGRPSQAWVFNAVANSVSLVNVSNPASPRVDDTIVLVDPTHPVVKRGRMAFNDADASTTGTFSCESCHPDGGTDQLVWVLNTPICSLAGCDQIPPRITMPIRGLRDTAPYHWDGIPGDPYGGINTANIRGSDLPNCSRVDAESCTRFLLDGSLATTMCETGTCPVNEEGKEGALTAAERDDMAKFLLSVPYPPAQRRSYTNVLSNEAVNGFRLFHIDGDLQGDPEPFVCGDCHRMPFWVSTNTPGTGMEAPTWRGAYDRWLILPQGRINLIDFDFYRNITDFGVPERSVWQFSWGGRTRFDPVWNMVLEGSTGFSGSFARQVTLNQASVNAALTDDLLDNLERSASEGAIVLQGNGLLIQSGAAGDSTNAIALQFDYQHQGGSYIGYGENTGTFTRAELVSLAADGKFVGTFTGRLGVRVDVDHPQPAIWSQGPIEEQRGPQRFPALYGDGTTMRLSGRHIREGANVYIDGRRVPGYATCLGGEMPNCHGENIEVQLAERPSPAGIHFMQLQNPGGLFSNDYIVHTLDEIRDNCPDIPNPDQADSDGDGKGDRCDDDAFSFTISPGISGNWFDPEHDGEGWFVEILNDTQALVYWFSYTPPAVGGERAQAWIGGLGEIRGSSVVVPAAASWISTGPPFGPDFDPQRVALRPWGKFVLSFSDCDNGVMYYRSDDLDYGNGSLNLRRLSQIEALDCGETQVANAASQPQDEFQVTPAISGAWYDPTHNGEGWLLEIIGEEQALLAWFSYGPDGEQAWFYNIGTVQGSTIEFDLLIPSGTDFGPTFDPDEVSRPAWGRATFTFDGCNSGSMSFESDLEEYGSGSLELVRLTHLSGTQCQ